MPASIPSCKRKVREYQILWHNMISAESIKEVLEIVESILSDLRILALWEKEGKIEAECLDYSPSIQGITVLDESIEPELRKISLVNCFEDNEDEEAETAKRTPKKSRAKR